MQTVDFEALLANTSRLAIIAIGIVTVIAALEYAQMILAPIFLAIVIGLMFGPLSDRIEQMGIPGWISALGVVATFLTLIAVAGTAFAVPLSGWMDRLPSIWDRLQSELTSWKGVVASIGGIQENLRTAMGQGASMKVDVEDTSAVESVVFFAPAFMAQIILFLASMYFFIATRNDIREAALSLCVNPRLRHSARRIFVDVEARVSRYLLSITAVNIVLGLAVSATLFALGVPSPLLWGMLAGALNYVIYIGPAVMALILTGVGLATSDSTLGILLPPAAYLGLNLLEAQFLTPTVLGRTMTLNPFVVLLSIATWIWLWGPVGGFIAVPSLLIFDVVLRNIMPKLPEDTLQLRV
ncbi:AI-2E family transporter [Stappia sp. MMSF_3263]|uniref:AI-2E family transporter n=1 Tax=Stappia sp. MMSF_3263 TaxID=3046693 RepID=UPI00273E3BBE|nr:AI-2E family transporter [Stappia sp. MMSF_3263]